MALQLFRQILVFDTVVHLMYVCIGVCLEISDSYFSFKVCRWTIVVSLCSWFVQACDLTSYSTMLPEITSKKRNILIYFFKILFSSERQFKHTNIYLITCMHTQLACPMLTIKKLRGLNDYSVQ